MPTSLGKGRAKREGDFSTLEKSILYPGKKYSSFKLTLRWTSCLFFPFLSLSLKGSLHKECKCSHFCTNVYSLYMWIFFKLVSEQHDFSFFNNYYLSGGGFIWKNVKYELLEVFEWGILTELCLYMIAINPKQIQNKICVRLRITRHKCTQPHMTAYYYKNYESQHEPIEITD